jgi:hypothetical protein
MSQGVAHVPLHKQFWPEEQQARPWQLVVPAGQTHVVPAHTPPARQLIHVPPQLVRPAAQHIPLEQLPEQQLALPLQVAPVGAHGVAQVPFWQI